MCKDGNDKKIGVGSSELWIIAQLTIFLGMLKNYN